MSERPVEPVEPVENDQVHTRLLKCALEVEDARAYWQHVSPDDPAPRARRAFDEYWFGARSMARVQVLLTNFRARFDAYPEALAVLRRWTDMPPEIRPLICHWHLQLSDPMYRAFTARYLLARRQELRAEVTRDLVVSWVGRQGPDRWTMSTRIQLASKLLSCAYAAGLVAGRRDPRPLHFPRIPDDALAYLLYLLRGLVFRGTILENPYLASVGLSGPVLDRRLRRLSALRFRRMGDLVDFDWCCESLAAWADTWLFGASEHTRSCA